MPELDFELKVSERDGGYELAVDSPAGGATVRVERPFEELALKVRLLALENALLRSSGDRRRVPTRDEQLVQDFGRELFDWLIAGELRGRFDVSRSEAKRARIPLRLKLRIDSPALASLPWEFLYDPRRGDYVALSTNTPVVRFVDVAEPIEPLTVTPPLRMLALVSSPTDRARLDIERERQRVNESTTDLQERGLLEVHWLRGATRRDLVTGLQQGPWHIFHFIGHGGFDGQSDEGIVALVDEDGATAKLAARDLARVLGDHMPLRLVVLNACEGAKGSDHDLFSSTAASILRFGTPAVVAMQYEITDRAAIEFSRAFYQAVADGNPVDVAMSAARQAMAVGRTLEWGTPVLFMRSPDGRIFDIRPPTSPKLPPGTMNAGKAGPSPGPGGATVPADAVKEAGAVGDGGEVSSGTAASTAAAAESVSEQEAVHRVSSDDRLRAFLRAPFGLSGRAVWPGLALLGAGVVLLFALLPTPPPSPTPSPSPSPSPRSMVSQADAQAQLAAQLPPAFTCSATYKQPHFAKEIAGVQCDTPSVDGLYYFLFESPNQAKEPFDYWVETKDLTDGDCLAGHPGWEHSGRFSVYCHYEGGRPVLGWVDATHATYGKANGRVGDSINGLAAWWQRNAVRHDMVDLVGGTQCQAVDWVAPRGLELSVLSSGSGAGTGTIDSQDPDGGTLLAPGDEILVSVAFEAPTSPLLDVTGRSEITARDLLRLTGNSRVRTILLPEDVTVDPGVVIGSVPRAGSKVDAHSCIALLVAGAAPAVPSFSFLEPTLVVPTSSP